MKNYFVIGSPIEHSLSPLIFNYLFDFYKIDAIYEKKLISSSVELNNFMFNGLMMGCNITSPYKEKVFNLVDENDLSALKYCSVTCIKKTKSGLIGFNTDDYGFLKMIENQDITLNNKNVLILGYGASAKTISTILSKKFNSNIFIYGRNNDKIDSFIDIAKSIDEKAMIRHYKKINAPVDIVINCLPVDIDRNSIISILNFLNYIPISNTNIFIDLNYIETDLNKEIMFNKNICNFILGLDMLIFQALKTFEIWFDRKSKVNYNEIKKVIR